MDNVDAAHAKVLDTDLEVVYSLMNKLWEVRRFFVKDPSGAVIKVEPEAIVVEVDDRQNWIPRKLILPVQGKP